MFLFLPTVSIVAADFEATWQATTTTTQGGSANNEIANSIWETSRIWPAVTQSERKVPSDNKQQQQMVICKNQYGFAITNGNTKVHRILQLAKDRLDDFIQVAVPDNVRLDGTGAQKHPLVKRITVTVQSDNAVLSHGINEAYNLTVSIVENSINIQAQTVYGALHALETLKQLLMFAYDTCYALPLIEIEDSPEYAYRGLMLDTSRHYLDMDSIILPNLRVMAAHKLNVLMWHMTDRESFPWKSKRYPELAEEGAFCGTCYYNDHDIRTVVQTAADLGIRVIVELDLPGHEQSIGKSHPEFMAKCDGGPGEVIDPTKNETIQFVHNLYQELVELFPDSMFHIGADEVAADCWQRDPAILNWLQDHKMSLTQLSGLFLDTVVDLVTKTFGKRPIMWEDPLVAGVVVPKHVIIDCWQMWRMNPSIVAPIRAGHDVLMSGCWYLDHLDQTWWEFYKCRPRQGFGLTQAQQQQVLGGHASMWGERVDPTNFFERVYPRASAMAEVLWSGEAENQRHLQQQLVTDRLSKFRCHLITAFRIPASPIEHGSYYCNTISRLAKNVTPHRSYDGGAHSTSSGFLTSMIIFLGGMMIPLVVVVALVRSNRLQFVGENDYNAVACHELPTIHDYSDTPPS